MKQLGKKLLLVAFCGIVGTNCARVAHTVAPDHARTDLDATIGGDNKPDGGGATAPICGNGKLEPGEICDTAILPSAEGACPQSCVSTNACASSLLVGSDCRAFCQETTITTCSLTKDGCCPANCYYQTDADCSSTCGNGVLDPGELCDKAISAGSAGACLTSCDDQIACTKDELIGGDCAKSCSNKEITACDKTASDGCCPKGCTSLNDSDCAATCGNGLLDSGETCDTAIDVRKPGACPTLASCDDSFSCTMDLLAGSGCTVACSHIAITLCRSFSDGCCPSGCNANNDANCQPVCGNGVKESGEECDTGIVAAQPGACPTNCNDNNLCTTDLIVGSNCLKKCIYPAITSCNSNVQDGCCPTGCNVYTDKDCVSI